MPAIQVIDGHEDHNDNNPNQAAIGAPVGSFYLRHTGSHREVWIKTAPGSGGWVRLI